MEILLIPVYWLYQAAAYSAVGMLIRGLFRDRQVGSRGILKSIFVGIAGLNILLQLNSIFFALNLKFHLCVMPVLLISGFFMAKRKYSEEWKILLSPITTARLLIFLLIFLTALLTLAYATAEINPYDAGLYHAQSVELARQFPAIPGIGNLHDRLAFNNSWFLNVAFFSVGPLAAKPFLHQNSFLFFSLIVYLLVSLRRRLETGPALTNAIAAVYLLVLLFFFLRYPLFISSISPDTALYVMACYVITELLFGESRPDLNRYCLLLLIAFYAATIKFSAALLLVLFAPKGFMVISKSRNVSVTFLILGLIAAAVFGPYFARGYILSGYPAYPMYFLNPFNPEWKVPVFQAIAHMQTIKAWARSPGPGYMESLKQPLAVWLSHWYSVYAADSVVRAYSRGVFALPFIFWALYIIKKFDKVFLTTAGLLLLTIAAAFVSAPDPRFAYANLVTFFAIIISTAMLPFLMAAKSFFFNHRKTAFQALAFLAILAPLYSTRGHWKNLLAGQPLPSYPSPKLVARQNLQGRSIMTPGHKGEQCWNWSPICTPYFNENVIFRGNDLQQGFLLKQ